MKSIPVGGSWSLDTRDPYDLVLQKLLQAKKVPKFAYPILKSVEVPRNKLNLTLNLSYFEKLFGVNQSQPHSSCIKFFLLCTKLFTYRCKYQKVQPSFQSLLSFIRVKQEIEYNIALKNCNLDIYFNKFIFDG